MSFKSCNLPVLDIPERCGVFFDAKIPILNVCKNCQLISEGKSSCFSMANLEEIHETELDIILGELNSLDQIKCPNMQGKKYCNLSNSIDTTSPSIFSSEVVVVADTNFQNHRTESPDNDSAFSDTVSLLSSESSASSNISSTNNIKQRALVEDDRVKAAKIQLALFKLEHATVKRLLIKAFTADGASKSVLVDERMTCGQVTRMLADKNHVEMNSTWALVENRNDLYIERFYEDHELLIDNIMLCGFNSRARLFFLQLPDKSAFFQKPENFLPESKKNASSQYNETSRKYLLEEFFNKNSYLPIDGPLFIKNDVKKAWKKYHFVLRESGLYYFPKEKKNSRDAVCLVTFHDHCVYKTIGCKKKFKSPNDFAFAIKSSDDLSLKMLCAEDYDSMEKWMIAIRIAKHGKKLWQNYTSLIEDIKRVKQKNDLSSTRCGSSFIIPSAVPLQSNSDKSNNISSSSGRVSRASSSSSSGCLSDDNGFDSEFTTGTIKRKPSMKPKLPLTTMTRQLKEVGEITVCESGNNTLTRRHKKNKNVELNVNDSLQKCQYLLPEDLSCFSGSPCVTSTSQSFVSSFDSYGRCSENLNGCNSLSFGNQEECQTSTSSLDSLPPPPPLNDVSTNLYGSNTSLSSLPLPPPPSSNELDVEYVYEYNSRMTEKKIVEKEECKYFTDSNNTNGYSLLVNKTTKPAVKFTHKRTSNSLNASMSAFRNQSMNSVLKTVSFADSSSTSKQKHMNETQLKSSMGHLSIKCKDRFPLSYDSNTKSSTEYESTKCLTESAVIPSRDFLKDLQRVMRKKWQVAQKCKLEPSTTPHEVLGFRDFPDEFCNNYRNFYRETANVSNWIQEHYGSGANYAVYENYSADNATKLLSSSPIRKKGPPPPPPKRSESTQLTHRV